MSDKWWKSVRHLYKELIEEMKDLIENVLREKTTIDKEFYETLFEDVWIRSEKDWEEIFHEDVPDLLRKVFKEIGFTCTIYHKKDDVPGYEYLLSCISEEGEGVLVGLNVEYDPETGKVELLDVEASPGKEFSPSYLVYYHEV